MDRLMTLQRKNQNFPTEDLPKEEADGTTKFYAWFSATAKKNICSHIYLDETGEEVEVTGATKSAMPAMYFKDIEYRGIVVKWIRSTNK